jgi:hypothetical protein
MIVCIVLFVVSVAIMILRSIGPRITTSGKVGDATLVVESAICFSRDTFQIGLMTIST